MNYRMLEFGEVIQEGDECFVYGHWSRRTRFIGEEYNRTIMAETRRPIHAEEPSDLLKECIEVFQKCAHIAQNWECEDACGEIQDMCEAILNKLIK